MKHPVYSAEDLGLALRAVRKAAKVRLDDLAHTADISKQTVTNVEKGRPTVQVGTILRMLGELGVTLSVDIPDDAEPVFRQMKLARQAARDPDNYAQSSGKA